MGSQPSKEEECDIASIVTSENAIDMKKATIMIWKNRQNPSIIEKLATLLAEHHDQKVTFEGFEFYLPQLAHMLIHLEVDSQSTALTQLILTACQQSLHLALQLHFILVAAMEDYCLELSDGRINAYGNPVYYRRCAKLLQNVHRCVVYLPENLKAMERLLENGTISKKEYQDKSRESKKIQAKEMIDQNIANDEKQDGSISIASIKSTNSSNSLSGEDQESNYKKVSNTSPSNFEDKDSPKNKSEGESFPIYEGSLRYKRAVRKRFCSLKRWQNKWFRIQHRVLYCYSQRDGRMIRAIPLESCTVKEIEYKNRKYENVFEVKSVNSGVETIFQMIAESKVEMDRWIRHIEAQSIAPTFGEEKLLYRAEYARYKFFKDQRDFINKLTDIAEDMRATERPMRKVELRKRYAALEIPNFTYSPLCKSTDRLSKILRILPTEARAFNTKARCPCLTIFEVLTEEVDVATYLHMKYESVIDKARLSMDGSTSGPGETSIGNLSIEDIKIDETPDGNENSNGILSWIKWGGSQELPSKEDEDSKELNNEQTSIVTYAINQKEGNQHSQDAPLLLGPDVDLNSPPTAPGRSGGRRASRFSLDLSSSASKYQEYMRPSVWRDEISKLSSKVSSVLQKKNDSDKENIEMTDDVSNFTLAKQKSVSKVDRHVPAYGETWIKKKERLLEESKNYFEQTISSTSETREEGIDVTETSKNQFFDEKKWDLDGFIVKSNDDLRQEVFVMQMIEFFGDLFTEAKLPLYVRPYKIMSTGNTTGLIQLVKNAISITALKEDVDYIENGGNLKQHFINTYGPENEDGFKTAQNNYIKSLAAYSIICYVMALKDRHNGNIMIDIEGHVVHIDFGFVFGIAPGGAFSFERAPFKLTIEMVELLGGPQSETWERWIDYMTGAFECIRNNIDVCVAMFEIVSFQSKFPCFKKGSAKPLAAYKSRLLFGKSLSREELRNHVCGLVRKSYNHCGTRFYDNFQLWTNGILP